MRSYLVRTVGVVMLLGACTSNSSDGPAPGPSTTAPSAAVIAPATTWQAPSAKDHALIKSSRRSAAAPRSFRERSSLLSCGEFAPSGFQPPPPLGKLNCLKSAMTGQGAELTVLQRTVEGDPVITYYRAGPDIRDVEVFTDWTSDNFGPGGWTRESRTVKALEKLGLS